MTAKDAIRFLLKSNQTFLNQYLADLSDTDLLIRPVPAANHIAWQLGHLITGEVHAFLSKIPGANPPTLPPGFAEQHSKETSTLEPPAGFSKKEEYLALFQIIHQEIHTALDKISEADLDKDSGWGAFAPTVGDLFLMIADHEMMHIGQFTVVRRMLGKPVVF